MLHLDIRAVLLLLPVEAAELGASESTVRRVHGLRLHVFLQGYLEAHRHRSQYQAGNQGILQEPL